MKILEVLKKSLNHYKTEIEIFNINTIEDEISISYIHREFIEENKTKLSYEQNKLLYNIDLESIELYRNVKDKKTIAVEYLEKIVNEFAKKNITEYEKLNKKIA